jgi:hypothetical protein
MGGRRVGASNSTWLYIFSRTSVAFQCWNIRAR